MPTPAYDSLVDYDHLSLYHDKAKQLFATQAALETLDGRVDDIVAEGGEPNTIETVKVNGSALTPDANKAVDVDVPTKVSDLTNDSGFQTASQVSTTVSTAISTALASAVTYKGTVSTYVQLPSSGQSTGDMWNVSADGMNYVWSGSAWDAQAPTVDLSGFVEDADVTIVTNAQINALFTS